jgi:lysophospholipase L1-like esterase
LSPRPRLPVPETPPQALRLVAAVLTVAIVLVLGAFGSAEPPAPEYHRYVAFGDSYTAAPFVPLSEVAHGCYRSSNNYPHLVAAALHLADLRDRSCTGARTADLLGRQTTARGERVAPQLTALTADTDLVTVGLGANNEHLYARLATQCRKLRTICPLHDQRQALGATVDRLRPALVSALEEIRDRAPRARILLVGYPKLLPQRGNCAKLPRFRPEDRATFRNINFRLRLEMAAAAREAKVEFVDFYTASIGHDVCAQHPWVQGRKGNGHVGAALHPLPAGQAALARMIVARLRTPPPEVGR